MANSKETDSPAKIWDRLSPNARQLSKALATQGELLSDREFLGTMSLPEPEGLAFDLDQGLEELEALGVIESYSFLDERRRILAQMERPRDLLFVSPIDLHGEELRKRLRLGSEMTSQEREYFRLMQDIERAEQLLEKDPNKNSYWTEKGYRLITDLQQYIEANQLLND